MRVTDETLKPCPFCGGEAEIWRAGGRKASWVACMGRCATLVSKEHTTDADAIAAWNRRAALAVEGAAKVKALEWKKDWRGELDDIPAWRAETPVGRLSFSVNGYASHDDAPIEKTEAVKAEVQADYEKRVLSCLEYTTPPAGIREALERDAARWNALLRCARIEVRGSAGFDPKTGKRRHYDNASRAMVDGAKGWVHFSADFWSEYPGHEDADKKGRWGTVALTALADEVIRKDEEESDATLRGQS